MDKKDYQLLKNDISMELSPTAVSCHLTDHSEQEFLFLFGRDSDFSLNHQVQIGSGASLLCN
jgi:hypothetical protein